MHVLIDYRPALRARSGVGEYVHRLVRALDTAPSARAVALTVFSSSWKDRLREDVGRARRLDLRVPVRLLNWMWHRLESPPVEWLGARPDVVHSPHPLLLPSRHAAQVITIHDLDFLEHPERTHAEVRRDYAQLVRAHAHRADRILVPSHHTAREVERLLAVPSERIVVCPHGAPRWPARAAPPRDGYLLFVGTLEPRKNVGALLDAYEILIGRRPGAPRLVLAGGVTPAGAAWLERLRRPPLAGRAEHIGYVEPTQRQALYAGALAVIVPSFTEGFGLPALEAMRVGVPVIVSRRGALPEVVGDAGLMVEPEADAIAAAMIRLVEDADLAARLGDLGRVRAATFTWERAAEIVVDTYVRAAARRSAAA